jgi:hypothetical protein
MLASMVARLVFFSSSPSGFIGHSLLTVKRTGFEEAYGLVRRPEAPFPSARRAREPEHRGGQTPGGKALPTKVSGNPVYVRSCAVLGGSLPWMRRDLTSRSLPYGGVLLVLRSAGPAPDIAVAALTVAVVGVRNSHLEERASTKLLWPRRAPGAGFIFISDNLFAPLGSGQQPCGTTVELAH